MSSTLRRSSRSPRETVPAARPRIVAVLGTRPEAIKLFPVVQRLRAEPSLDTVVVTTGQHREMVDDVLRPLGVTPDVDLDLSGRGPSLNELVARSVALLEETFDRLAPSMVLVQGDTTTAFCGALAAFHRGVPIAHVEAGLRTNDRFHPFPEEANRRMISVVSDLHFAPTPWSARNLLDEGVAADSVVVTGNTAIDSMLFVLRNRSARGGDAARADGLDRPHVLVTLHRRESWIDGTSSGGSTLDAILAAIRRVAQARADVLFSYPVHPNPRVTAAARRSLGDLQNVRLLPPQPYLDFDHLMAGATLIVTDSGGIQEEAPTLGIPVLVARDVTERPEGVVAGCNRLIGTAGDRIERELARALAVRRPAREPLPRPNPFGDGRAAARIVQAILHRFQLAARPAPFTFAPALARATLPSLRRAAPIEWRARDASRESA
jgi:UDP-N-acetylglucosamine 2-epimerase (non-hydrolysing)